MKFRRFSIKDNIFDRFILSAALFAGIIVVAIYLFEANIGTSIEFAKLELDGNQFQRPVMQVMHDVGLVELLLHQYAQGRASKSDLDAAIAETNKNFLAWQAADAKFKSRLKLTDAELTSRGRENLKFDTIYSKWKSLSSGLTAYTPQKKSEFQKLKESIKGTMAHSTDASNLILDPDLDTFYLMDMTTAAFPAALMRIQDIGHDVLSSYGKVPDDRAVQTGFAVQSKLLKEIDISRISTDLDTLLKEDSNYYGASATLPDLAPTIRAYLDGSKILNTLLDQMASGATDKQGPAMNEVIMAYNRGFDIWRNASIELESMLNNRAHQFHMQRIWVFLGCMTVFAFAVWFFIHNIRLVVQPIVQLESAMNDLSCGILTEIPVSKSRHDEIGRLEQAASTLSTVFATMTSDLIATSERIIDGQLDVRIDTASLQGSFKQMIEGVNKSLDAAVVPLRDAAGVVEQLSKGQVPDPIDKTYNGDFGIMKNLNSCIGAIGLLVKEARTLSDGAIAGQLSIRGDVSRHMGDYQKIIDGFNSTLVALTEPINEMVKVLNAMSAGNLNGEMDGQYAGDFGQIQSAVNQTLGSLNRILNQVLIAADQLKEGAKEISDSAKLISQGATKSASSLEEITSSMQSIEMQAQQNSQNAGQVNDLAIQNKTDAASGSEKMTQMLAAMDEINASSENISKIINVINEIAFQTNLLALNAAVEAARAGRHGKGFAVVAEEVRNLATRSAKAVDETNTLILTSIEKVKMGTEIADLTQQSFSKMVEGAAKVSGLVNDIAKVSEAQTKGIEEINIGINELNKVTQSNAAGSQELASSAQELTNQATYLKEQISKFTLSTKWGESNPQDSVPAVSAEESLKLAFATTVDTKDFGGF